MLTVPVLNPQGEGSQGLWLLSPDTNFKANSRYILPSFRPWWDHTGHAAMCPLVANWHPSLPVTCICNETAIKRAWIGEFRAEMGQGSLEVGGGIGCEPRGGVQG